MSPTLPPDAVVVDLLRGGADPAAVYAALWPQGRPDLTPAAFAVVARALYLADATALPPEQLPAVLEEAEQDLLTARASICRAIGEGKDATPEGEFDRGPHDALVKNTEALLKCQAARQERQAHVFNLRVARERARQSLCGEDVPAAGARQ